MPDLITALKRSVINKKLREKKTNSKKREKKHGKTNYLNLKDPSNNVKIQLDKTLTTQI